MMTSTPEILEMLQKEYGLDEFQAPAANHFTGPALVLACAGSGKTTSLTARVTHLIRHYKVPADQILCITFTNKATDNMRVKISKKLGNGVHLPTISTIHSLGLKVIREHPKWAFDALLKLARVDYVPLESDKTVHLTTWTERNSDTAFKRICEEQRGQAGNYGDVLDKIMFLCNRGFVPDTYLAALEAKSDQIDAERVSLNQEEVGLWRAYIRMKFACRAIDFTDMMLIANRVLEEHPKVKAKYHERWRYILQDEAQDASLLQWRLLELLTNPITKNLYCVGDASQSIMGFNGASSSLLQNFRENFQGVKPAFYPLLNNYRSHKTIIEVANAIEGQLIGNHPAPMIGKANIDTKGALSYIEYTNSIEEANSIAQTILTLAAVPKFERFQAFLATPKMALGSQRPVRIKPPVSVKPFKLKDIVILVRTKLMIPTIENALLMCQIPYYVKNGKSLLQTKEVMDLLSYFKVLVNPFDIVAFERAVQVPKRGFGGESIKKLIAHAQSTQVSILKAAEDQSKVPLFLSLIEGFGRRFEADPKDIIAHITFWIDAIKYKDEIKKSARDTEDEERRHENIKRFGILAQDILDRGDITTIPDLLDYISLMQDAGASSSDDDRVHLMTAHSSKGLEYEVVFAPCFFEGAIPHKKSLKYPEELAEEARLVYVIFTRAIRQLRVSRPQLYATNIKGSGPVPTLRSQFFEPVRKFFQDPKNIL